MSASPSNWKQLSPQDCIGKSCVGRPWSKSPKKCSYRYRCSRRNQQRGHSGRCTSHDRHGSSGKRNKKTTSNGFGKGLDLARWSPGIWNRRQDRLFPARAADLVDLPIAYRAGKLINRSHRERRAALVNQNFSGQSLFHSMTLTWVQKAQIGIPSKKKLPSRTTKGTTVLASAGSTSG